MAVAHIVKPRGIKGEVAAEPLTDHAERFEQLTRVALVKPGAAEAEREIELEDTWFHGDRVILKFSGIDSMTDAEFLRGLNVCVPLAERPPAPEGEVYVSDLPGSEVVDGEGRVLGRVERLENYGGRDLLVVKQGQREFLVPFISDICVGIDLPNRRIEVKLPEGLQDL